MIALQLLVNGLIAGSLYALVAAGFSLIYSVNRFLHFAHGAVVTVCAYLLFTFFSLLGLNFFLACGFTLISGAMLGWLMHLVLYKPLRNRGGSNAVLLVASIGLMIFLENLMLLIFGADVKTVRFLPVREGLHMGGVIITPLQLVIIGASGVLLAALWLLLNKTKAGMILRAVSDHAELARISGVNAHRVHTWSYMLGSALAAFAAIFVSLEQNIEPTMGTMLIVKGFTGAVIGGVTSVPGAVVGSYLLGIIENLGIWWLPSGWKDAIAFVLLFLFLLLRPSGIFGISKGIRE